MRSVGYGVLEADYTEQSQLCVRLSTIQPSVNTCITGAVHCKVPQTIVQVLGFPVLILADATTPFTPTLNRCRASARAASWPLRDRSSGTDTRAEEQPEYRIPESFNEIATFAHITHASRQMCSKARAHAPTSGAAL